VRAVMKVNIVQAPKMSMQKPTRHNNEEGCSAAIRVVARVNQDEKRSGAVSPRAE